MQRLSPAAEFEHLAQNRDPTRGGRVSQHVQHGVGRIRVGVVAIVKNLDAADHEALAAHFSGLKISNSVAQTIGRDSVLARHRDPGEDVGDAVAANEGALEVRVADAKAHAFE